jgi:hypothetical protein
MSCNLSPVADVIVDTFGRQRSHIVFHRQAAAEIEVQWHNAIDQSALYPETAFQPRNPLGQGDAEGPSQHHGSH